MMNIPFIDLKSQYQEIKSSADRSLKDLMKRGDFVLGQNVRDFEKHFARYCGVAYGLGVNSGTDALFLGLLSLGIGRGNDVIVPAFTYIASAFAVSYTGARPVFADIDEKTYNMDPQKIESLITRRTRAIMPVHLYGQSADMTPILRIARRHDLFVIEDAAQAHGTLYGRKKAGSLGDVGCYSFYPTKNLGALGDAGLIVTNREKIYERLKKLRDYGRKTRYEHSSLGYNSRLDSLQALFLDLKLKNLDVWNEKRRSAAALYRRLLKDTPGILLPEEASYGKHVYHIFAVRIKKRDAVLRGLQHSGIHAGVHYPVPLHLQEVYKGLGTRKGSLSVSEKIAREILCLPIYPHITPKQIEYVCHTLKGLVNHE
jgi:dTDP-4-amino-4,6-dideoxygalactose transaminase